MDKKNTPIKDFWLFGKSAETLKGRHNFLFIFWNWALPVLMIFGTGILSLSLAFGQYGWGVLWSYITHPLIMILNLLPPLILFVLFFCIIGRSWIAYLISSSLVIVISAANYFLLMFRNDPLMFADIVNLSTAMGVAGEYDLSMDARLWLCVVCIAIATVILALFAKGKPARGIYRAIIAIALILICVFGLKGLYTDNDIYKNKTQNFEYLNRWSATQLYISKGFAYPFLHSVKAAFPTEPQGYDEEYAKSLLEPFEDVAIPEDKQVEVIAVMLEAFTDMSDLGIEGLSDEVYSSYHSLESESYSGTLVTNIFAGGTVVTEQCFLTGYVNLNTFRSEVNSHVWYLRNQGFATNGSHPHYEWFYNRSNVNSYLGFEDYYFLENYYGELADGGVAYDDIFFPALTQLQKEEFAADTPNFSYNLTYQGHGPYSDQTLRWPIYVEEGTYSQESWYIMNNYFGSVANTIENIDEMVDELNECSEPVVLLLFGDHKPWFGDSNSVYTELGINIDTSTEEGFYNYYSTNYIIWANDAAKDVLENDFVGKGPTISSNYLMNVLFEQCGWTGSAWMQYTNQVRESLPVIHRDGYYLTSEGVFTTNLDENNSQVLQNFEIVEYYVENNFSY